MSPAAETARVAAVFRGAFGRPPDLLVRAPGRVNLIGEHTDYNDGFVLPCAIDRATTVAIGRTTGTTVSVVAADFGGSRDSFALDAPIARRSDLPWANHPRAVHAAMLARGLALAGGEIAIGGDVPQGAGLSSSASLGVALAKALAMLNGHDGLATTEIARIAQAAENDFVGVSCGIMDQLVAARAIAGHALLIDCRTLSGTPVPMPPDVAVMVVHSGVERNLARSDYNARRAQCSAAARHYEVEALRDLDAAQLVAERCGLALTTFRRARHVVTENARTLAAADALRAHDLARLGDLFATSHASMRDDFEITVPAVDALVAIAAEAVGADGGARMTGGGFGGCVVVITPRDRAAFVTVRIRERYKPPTHAPLMILDCLPSAGVKVVV